MTDLARRAIIARRLESARQMRDQAEAIGDAHQVAAWSRAIAAAEAELNAPTPPRPRHQAGNEPQLELF